MAWPTSPGKVISSSVVQERDEKLCLKALYRAEVVYEFNVNNTTFSGKRISHEELKYTKPSKAQEIVNLYPQDTNVTVYYMPSDPKVCLLEVGVKV